MGNCRCLYNGAPQKYEHALDRRRHHTCRTGASVKPIIAAIVIALVLALCSADCTPIAPDPDRSVTVYVTQTGEKYHRIYCRYLMHSKIGISLRDAKQRGYSACLVCRPPIAPPESRSKRRQRLLRHIDTPKMPPISNLYGVPPTNAADNAQ